MRQGIFVLIIISIFLFNPSAFSEKSDKKEQLKIGNQAPKFVLKDADNKEYSLDKIISKDKGDVQVLILLIGDQTTRKSGNKWAKELDKLYKGKKEISIFMIADLRGLPFYVTESMVKWGTKREKLPVPILLDWNGKINELYKTRKGEPNLYVIDREYKIRYYNFGQFTLENLKALQVKAQENLKEKKTS
ncbi:MAG: Redoxin protein [Candidatus Poribacteria bacterium]|nr:Redoxin protein [Candidatus Poribacteria bacterium]